MGMVAINLLNRWGREIEAVECAFAQGFVGGDFAVAGGVFEAASGEAGGEVDFAAFVEPGRGVGCRPW